MDDANVAFRLKGFIDSQGLSHSQFSDRCGIPRPSLSQILSGRNKKISDVIVGQIHKAFPELSILWLLFGEGSMISVAQSDSPDVSTANRGSSGFDAYGGSGTLFDDSDLELSDDGKLVASVGGRNAGSGRISGSDNKNFTPNGTINQSQANVKALTAQAEELREAEKQIVDYENRIADLQSQIERLRANPRKVSHITVYYDDSTFETFVPQR